MDTKRALSLAIGAAGTVLLVLGFAAAPTSLAWSGTYVVFVGGSLGFAIGGYRDHRRSGSERPLLWALAYGGSMLLFFVAFIATAAAIRPTVSQNLTLRDAWLGLAASGLVLGAISTLLWERKPRRRRIAAILLLGVGLIFAGFIAVGQGGWWVPLGVLSVPVGLAALLVAIVHSILERERETAEGTA